MIRHDIEENPKIFSFLIFLSKISMKQPCHITKSVLKNWLVYNIFIIQFDSTYQNQIININITDDYKLKNLKLK